MHTTTLTRALLGGTASLAIGFAACAQDTSGAPQPAASNTAPATSTSGAVQAGEVEEIIVTAERRESNLQKTPIAITALTAANIEAQGIRNVNDLAAFVPNLTTTTGPQGSADANFFIRGVGQFDFIATNDPGVGVYVDGVYLGRTVGALLDAGDIGRVEVLRGPQGTLFGRNTLGGAVSVTSIAPTIGEFSARGHVTGGSRNRLDIDGAVNIPLGDQAAGRIYAFTRSQDGFARNPVSGANFGAIQKWGVKGEFLLKPTDSNFSLSIVGDYTKDKSNPAPSVLLAIAPLPFFPAGALTQTQDRNNFYRVFESNSPKSYNEIWGFSGTAAYNWGPRTIKSITAYRQLRALSTSDPDGTDYRLYDQSSPTAQHQFSEELQLSGKAFNDKFEYLLGGYYFNERVQQTLFLCFAPITPTPTAPFNACNTWNQGNDQTTNSYAAFGQARYHFTDKLSFTAGGRYTNEDKSDISNQAFDFRPAGFSPAPGVVVPGFLAPIVTNLPGTLHFERFTPKLGLEFQANHHILLFADYSEGFRSGGFNGRLIAPQPPTLIAPHGMIPTYRPDTTQSGEIGVKSDLFDRKLRLNLTGFYTKYKAIQQTISVPVIQFEVANAGEAEIYGLEAEATAVPIDGLRINFAAGYAPSKFQNVPANVGPINGNKLPFAPEVTISAGIEYGMVAGPVKITPRVDYRYKSRTYFTAFNNNFGPGTDDGLGEQQKPLGLLQARLTIADKDDRYSLAVYGDNLTDEKYYTFGQNALGAQGVSYSYLGRPREFGVTAGFRF